MSGRRPSDPSTPGSRPVAGSSASADTAQTSSLPRRPRAVSSLFSNEGPDSVSDGDVIDASSEAPGVIDAAGPPAPRPVTREHTARQRAVDASSASGSLPLAEDDDAESTARRHVADDGALPERERAFGPYTLLRRLAFGGMGEVFLARRDATLSASLGPGLARLVVIKRILAHMRRDEKQRRAFVDEARLQTLLRSPNIVQVHDVGEVDGQVFLAMEHVHGPSLRALIDHCRRARQHIPLAFIVDLMVQAADALSYAHNLVDASTGQPLRIVHRDINPHNILVTYDGEVKIIDFGIAKSDLREQQTETGTIKGKFAYMSPEQSAAEPLDARSDLFALGICFYELVTLLNPFKRGNIVLSLEAIQRTTPALPSTSRPGAAILDPIIERMLRKNPDDRFADCGEVADALRRLVQDGLIPEPRQALSPWLRATFAVEIQGHLRVLEETGSPIDVVVSSPRLQRSGAVTSSRSALVPRGDAAPLPVAAPVLPAPEDLPPPTLVEPLGVGDAQQPGASTGPTGALQLSPRRSNALAAAVTLGVAGAVVAAWFGLRTPSVVAATDAGAPVPVATYAGVSTANAGGAIVAAADAGVVDAGASAAVVADGGAAVVGVDAGASIAAVVVDAGTPVGSSAVDRDLRPRDPPPPPDIVARIAVNTPSGFVVKGPRTLGSRQPTLLVVDDRDAPFKLRLRLRADAGGARVSIESEPWAIVRVDQVGRGRTPVADVALAAGRKTLLSLQNPAGGAMELALTVTPTKP